MNMLEMMYEAIKEIQHEVKKIREDQLKQGFDIKDNKENLVEHMRRTELLENRIEQVKDESISRIFLIKFFTGISAVCGALYSILRFFGWS